MRKMSALKRLSRLNLAKEKIFLVRRERGLKAQGDVLLRSALKSVSSNNKYLAKEEIEKFLQIVPDLDPGHRAVLDAVNVFLLKRNARFLVPIFLDAINWILTYWLKLKSKTPMSCKSFGIIYPIYINETRFKKFYLQKAIIYSGYPCRSYVGAI